MVRRALKRVILWALKDESGPKVNVVHSAPVMSTIAAGGSYSSYAHLAKQRIRPAMERYPEKQP